MMAGAGAGGASAGMSGGGMSGGGSGGASGGMSSGGAAGANGGMMGNAGSGGAMAGAAGGSSLYPPNWDTVKLVLTGTSPQCGSSDCHGGIQKLVIPTTITDDVGMHTMLTTFRSSCGPYLLVKPGEPQFSALLRVLRGACCEIPQMPNGCRPEDFNCVPDDAIDAVEQWISAGALMQ
jgi:hypothetical protein